MKIPSGCPDDSALARWAAGPGAASQEAIERHLAACSGCCARIGWIHRGLEQGTAGASGPEAALAIRAMRGALAGAASSARSVPARSWKRPAWAAAAVLALAAAGALSYGWKGSGPGSRDRLPEEPGLLSWDLSGALSIGPAETRTVLLPEGTRLRLGAGTRLETVPPRAEERWHLRLQTGEVEASVSPGKGHASISAPAGQIEILGTRFRAKAFRLHLASSLRDALFVELHEGKVRLRNAQGSAELQPSSRGLILAGEAPTLQEGAQDSERRLLDLARVLRPEEPLQDDRSAWLLQAVSLWGGGWKGSGSWSQALREGPTPDLREGTALLMGLCASDLELRELIAASRSEPEENVRRTFLRVLHRRLPDVKFTQEER